ncbi:MAG: hypothetical protein ACLR4A_04935 [Christensenellales bacterium]
MKFRGSLVCRNSLSAEQKELLSKEQVRFEDVIANAEYHRQVAKKERELAEQARNEMISIRDQAEAEKKKLEDQREKSIRKAKDEAKRIVENAKRESEAMIAELRAMKKAGGAQEHEIQKLKNRWRRRKRRWQIKRSRRRSAEVSETGRYGAYRFDGCGCNHCGACGQQRLCAAQGGHDENARSSIRSADADSDSADG